jgi:hypothetical protein
MEIEAGHVNPIGKMPEWLNGTVSKTVVGLVSTEGSNPSLPAMDLKGNSSL